MKGPRFLLWLFLTTGLSLFLVRFLTQGAAQTAGYIIVLFFFLFTLGMLWVSRRTIQSSNPYLFTRVFMVSVLFKIVFIAMVVLCLVKFMELKPKELAVPLLANYLLYTVLETWMLMKLSKNV